MDFVFMLTRADRTISDGLEVRSFNDRGGFRAKAVVTAGVKRGVVQAPSIWWGRFASDGMNANETTFDFELDLMTGKGRIDPLGQPSVQPTAGIGFIDVEF